MTTQSVTPGQLDLDAGPPPSAAPASVPENAFLAGNPAALGIPVFVAGSVALALALTGYVPAGAVGAPLAIIAGATGLGLTIATVWAAAVGQSAVASVFGIFGGFWLSYALLVFGLLHNWFAITPAGEMCSITLCTLSAMRSGKLGVPSGPHLLSRCKPKCRTPLPIRSWA
jgi:hypothetical protein